MTTHRLYPRWIAANAAGELFGLGATGAVGWWVVRSLGEPTSAVGVVGTALLAVIGGTLFEGVLVGCAQAWALRFGIPLLRASRWIVATALGACVAWILGMLPSTLMALSSSAGGEPPPAWLSGPLQYALAAGLGAMLGPILALPQSIVLRPFTGKPGYWILANAVAWALGMPILFLGAGSAGSSSSPALAIALVAVTCLVTGIAVGAVHGWVLVRLIASARQPTSVY